MRTARASLLLLCLGLAGASASQAEEVRVRATLEPEVIGAGETATLTIEVQGGGFGRLGFRPGFELQNLEIVGGPYQYEDMRYENGHLSRSSRVSWRLRPLGTGTARVAALGLRLRGQVVRLPDREIQVQAEPTGSVGAGRADEPREDDPFEKLFGMPAPWDGWDRDRQSAVFLRAEVEPQRPFVGQQAVYTVHLYTREDVSAVTARDLPTFRGFWVHDIPRPQQIPTEIVEVGGQRYSRVVLLQKALFPLRAGRYELEPTAMDVLVRVMERRFFGPSFSRPEQLSLRTSPKVLDVQPLPPAPYGFGGAVGRLALTARLEPAQLRLGEAATLHVTLAGQGNLEGMAPPRLARQEGLQIYPPQQDGEEKVDGTVVKGSKTWSFVVVPDRTGRYTLKTPQIPYFDPASRSYQMAAAPPLTLTALPRPAVAASSRPALGEPHGIRTAAVSTAAAASAAWTQPAFWQRDRLLPWLFLLPWGIVLLVSLARRRTAGHPAGSAATAARTALPGDAWRRLEAQLAEAESESRPRHAAAKIEEAWRSFLAESWEIPPATPPGRWPLLLEERGADPAAVSELAALDEDLKYLRHAPQLSATEALRGEVISRSRRLVRRLR